MKKAKKLIAFLMAVLMITSIIPGQNLYAAQLDKSIDSEQTSENIMSTENVESTEEIISETTEATEEVDTSETEENTEQIFEGYLINYVVLGKENVTKTETQDVVIGIGDGSYTLDDAILYYTNQSTGEKYTSSADQISDDAVSFSMRFDSETSAGQYNLEKIVYTIGGKEYSESFAEAGIEAVFGVENEVNAEPDAIVVEGEEIENSDVEMDVVSFDENGNQVSEVSIESAIENAQASVPATLSDIDTLSTRSKNVTVVLDPGHDNTHAGARANGIKEEEANLKIALYCKEELEKYSGVKVYLTRNASGSCPYPGTTAGGCNSNRVNYAKSVGADVYVSIHNNSADASSAKGAMVFYPNSNYNAAVSQTGKDLAMSIEKKLVDLGLYNRGIKVRNAQDDKYPDGSAADYYGVIRNSKLQGIPAIIIEHAFLTNSSDVNNFLNSDEKLKKLGVADATGIAEYFGLSNGLQIKSSELSNTTYNVGTNVEGSYEVNDYAYVTVDVYNGDNSYLMNLSGRQLVSPGKHTFSWNLKGTDGKYVYSGTYRFTITATNDAGEKDVVHNYFSVTGNDAFEYKWALLGDSTYEIGKQAELYYAVNRNATVTVGVYDEKGNYIENLISNEKIGTNDQVVRWDLKNAKGIYVKSGTYRFTISATDDRGYENVVHKYFTVTGNDALDFKWVELDNSTYTVGNNVQLYYALNKNAIVNIEVYDGNNNYLKTIINKKSVGTNDQVASWDLKNAAGNYVETGRYRFTITASNSDGEEIVKHAYFNVKSQDPVDYKWTNLSASEYKIGSQAELYYAVSRKATVTVNVYDGKNNYLRTLISEKSIETNDQVVRWDLKDKNSNYVRTGTYRFTISATDENGNEKVVHKYFNVSGNDGITFKWTNLTANSYTIEDTVELYYAVSENAKVTIEVYDGNNNYLRTLENQKAIKTNDQVVRWDMKKCNGSYVSSGTYRITLTATANDGMKTVVHKYFQVEGRKPVEYKWTNLDKSTYTQGTDTSASLYYAVNRDASVQIDIYYENNTYMKTLQKSKDIGTNDQVAIWNFKDANGRFVDSGTYRFTITAIDTDGNKAITHKYFKVQSLYAIMGNSNTSVNKMVTYFNANRSYPEFYRNSDAPTIEQFCQIYMEECSAENVRAEVAFAQAMKETGFLQFGGKVKIEQYNFAGIGAVDSGVSVPASFSSVREGVRAQIQHLKAYATTEPLKNNCVDPRFGLVKRGSAAYVEWLGVQENPNHVGWATAKNYGYSIKNNYMSRLLIY